LHSTLYTLHQCTFIFDVAAEKSRPNASPADRSGQCEKCGLNVGDMPLVFRVKPQSPK
jgi:hypothetical protein